MAEPLIEIDPVVGASILGKYGYAVTPDRGSTGLASTAGGPLFDPSYGKPQGVSAPPIAPEAPPPPPPPQMAASDIRAELAAQQAAIPALEADLQRQAQPPQPKFDPFARVSTPSARRPVVERMAMREFTGMPGTLPGAEEIAAAFEAEAAAFEPMSDDPEEQRQEALAFMADWQARRQEALAQLAMDPASIAQPGGPSVQAAQLGAAQTVAETTAVSDMEVADVMERAYQAHAGATQAWAENEQARRAQQAEALQRLQDSRRIQQDALNQLQSLPEIDPQRYMKSLSGGQRFAAIVGAMLTGWSGSFAVSNMIQQDIERDLEAQKFNKEQRRLQGTAAFNLGATDMQIYNAIAESLGDESAADLMWVNLQMEDAIAELESVRARSTVAEHQAALYQGMVQLRAAQVANQNQLEMRLATTPRQVGRYAMGPREWEIEKYAMRKGIDTAHAGQQALVNSGLQREEMVLGSQLATQQAVTVGTALADVKGKGNSKNAEDEFTRGIGLIDEKLRRYERTGDVPGAGAGRVSELGSAVLGGGQDYQAAAAEESEMEVLASIVARAMNPDGKISDHDMTIARGVVGLDTKAWDTGRKAKLRATRDILRGAATAAAAGEYSSDPDPVEQIEE